MKKLLVGLTGGLGAGKSTVLGMMRKKGAQALDADQIVHELLNSDAAVKRQIGRGFGPDVVVKGKVNRQKLADIVFRSRPKLRQLEQILHPLVRKKMMAQVKKSKRPISVCDVPLLYEKGWNSAFNKVVVVTATDGIRRSRLLRRGLPISDINARMKAQWPQSRKVRKADFVVENSGSLSRTKAQVNSVWASIKNLLELS